MNNKKTKPLQHKSQLENVTQGGKEQQQQNQGSKRTNKTSLQDISLHTPTNT